MERNENNMSSFYKCGATSFLTGGTMTGDQEMFYMHVVRFYIPATENITFERHTLGVGIFNIQGFERWNNESKTRYDDSQILKEI